MNEYIRPNKAFRKISGCSVLGNVTYIYGVTCFGKTELIKQFFADTEYFYTTCMEHEWEESEIPEYSEQRAKTGNLYPIVIDDLHRLWNVEKRQAVIDLANRDDIWLILISRSNIPSWLQDSYLRRNYVIISENELGIDRYDIEKYLDENDIIIEPERIEWMIKTLLTNGFAIKQAIVNHVNGLNVDLEMCKKIGQDYIRSLNERVMIWLPNDVKDFLLKISLADSFNVELAKFLTGDRNVADLILKTVESGNFLYKQDDEYFLRSQMKKFLLNELHKKYSEDVINDHLRKIALYYELNNNEEKAFECYAKCHDTEKISSILCRVSQNTPETSYYYEMRKYYLMLSEREIESQICLMSTMAMLHSVMMDVEKSEYWYEKMKERLLIAKGEEKRELTARLAYLDLALPHRGSMNAFEIIKKSITLLKEKSIPFPEFSVTSNLPSIMNGGKDFCDWSKKDKELAKTFGKAISAFLGAHGKGFVKIALAESMYEKCGDSYEISELISGARNEIESGGGKYTMLFVAAALQTNQYIMDGDIKKSQYAIMYYSPSDLSYYLGIREGFNDTLQHNDMKIGTIADFGGGAESADDMMSKMKLTVGDFDGNGTDDIAFYDMKNSDSKINVYKYSVGSDVQKNSYLDMRSSSGYWVKMKEFDVGNCTTTVALASGDLDNDGICDLAYAVGSKSSDNCTVVLNTDNDTAYMKYSGKHYYSYSDPCVLAVLASPPYFKDLLNKEGLSGGYAQSSTTYGASKGTETGTGSSKSIMAGGYVSFEQDFSFMGMVDIASVEAEAEFTGGFTDEYMDTSGLTFSADYSTSSGSDAVVLYSIPSIKYEYEYYIPNHENNSYVVNKEIVTIPRTPAVITMELDEYDTIAAEYPELPKIKDNILTHTVGEPATYPKSINSFKKATVYDGEFFGVGFTSAENGMTQSQSIEITEQSEYKYDTTFATSESVGAGAGGITVGAKFDYESSDSEVNVSAVGCTFSAEMQNMPIEAKDYGYGMNWKLFSYEGSYKNANGESVAFPVLSYIVSDVSQPFDIPSDFEQDYENSSSNEIALSWTYPKNTAVEGFDIYRYYEKSGISGSYYVGSVDVSDGISTSDGMSYSFKDTNLPPYTEFEYQIKAVSSSAPFESMFSNTIKASTFSDEGLPEIELRGLNNDGNIYVYPDSSDKIVADVTNIDMYNSGIIYQWQKKDGDIWYDIAGKTSDSYSFVSSGYSTAGEYRCRVSGIYYDKTAAQAFYVTTYSDSFNAIFDMRKAVAENEIKVTYENNIPEAEVTLVSSDSTHHNVPTGNVIFKIEGGGYSKSYTVALRSDGRKSYAKLSDFNSYSNDKVTELPDGYYTLSVYYCGNKMFSSSEIGEDKFVIGAEGYYVRVSDGDNETTEIPYGSNVIVRLYKITDADSAPEFVKESNVGITYDLGPHTASISNNGINYKTQYRTVKREIHVKALGATHFIVGNVTAEQLPKLTLSNGSLAPKHQNDKNDPSEVVELQYLNSNKEAVSNGTLSNGLYTPNLVIKDDNYNIEYDELPDVMVTSEMVTVTVTPVKYAGIKVGTVSMTSPDVFTSEQLEKGIEYSPDSSITLKAETFEGYEVDCWKIKPVNGTNVTTMYGEKITYRMLNEKVEIKVYFKPVTNTLGYEEKPEGGKVIAPTGFTNNSVVRPGNEFTFKAVPDTGYHFVRWEKITSSLTEKIFDAEYRLVMPDEDVYLYPVFEKSSFSINFNGSKLEAVCNGKVLKGSSVNALYGDTVTIRPANGSRIADGAKWIINGTETNNSDASFVIQKLNSDMTVSIDTELMNYNASVKAEKGSVTVKYGNNTETGITDREYTDIDGDTELVLTANADYGFVFDHWDVNGSNAGSENSYTVSFSENKVNVKAVFRQNENKYTMSLDAGKHGKIVYSVKSADGNMIAENAEAEISDITVYKNDTVSLKFVPDKFRSLVYWDVNGNVNMSKELKLENIDKNYAIKAENAATAYTNVYYSVDIPDAAILSARTYENDYISGDYIGYGDELTISADKITNGYSIAYWTINGAVITDDENNVCTDSTVSINADGVTDVILHVEKTDVIPASRFAAPNVTVNNEEGSAGWNAVEGAECYDVKLIANNYTFFEKYITATDITFETIPQNCIVSVVAGYISNGRFIENSDAGIAEISAKSLREKPVVSAEGSVISWNKVNGIANYVVTVNGTSYFAENQNSMTIVTEPHTEYNITVAGVIGNTADSYAAITENGEYTYTTGHIDADSDNVCDDCGKVIASKIRNMSVSIGSDFSMRFAVQLTDEQLDAKMIFTREGTDISEPVSGVYDEEMNCYIYTYNGIKTQWLADSVKAELVLNDEVLDTMSDRSVLNYCDKIYNASKTIPEYEKYVVLMADMLEYGAEAQKYIGYNTDRLANSPEWVAQNKTIEFKVPDSINSQTDSAELNTSFCGKSITLNNAIDIRFKIQTDNTEGLSIVIKNGQKEISRNNISDLKEENGYYIAVSDPVKSTQYNDAYTAVLMRNGVEIQSATYSVNSCIAENYKNSALGNLFVALVNFGASAYNFEK